MKKTLAATAFLASMALPVTVLAQDQPSGTGGPHTFTANIGLFSEYIFRGVTQTGGEPAVQGGFDYSHATGFYAGTWASNVSWLQDFKQFEQSSVEWDFYGGFKRNIGATDFYFDVGSIYYWFPRGDKFPGAAAWSPNTWEIYAGGGWKWLGFRYSYSLSDYFGARPNATAEDSQGSWYLDFFANYPIGETGITLIGHYGILDVANDGDRSLSTEASYNDWKLGASYTVQGGVVKGLELGAYYTDTDIKNGDNGRNWYSDATSKNLKTADSAFVVYVKKTF